MLVSANACVSILASLARKGGTGHLVHPLGVCASGRSRRDRADCISDCSAVPSAQRGDTLIGVMVGMAVGLIVLSGVFVMIASTLNLDSKTVNSSYLNQELKTIMDLMVRDIRRAQYTPASQSCIGGSTCSNEFTDGAEDWTVSSNEIDYTYDIDSSGHQDNGECAGFRLATISGGGRVEKKVSCTPSWQPLSDEGAVSIDDLRFSGGLACVPSGSGFLAIREVKIFIQGSVGDATRRMCQKVRVKNDLMTSSCTTSTPSTGSPFDLCPP